MGQCRQQAWIPLLAVSSGAKEESSSLRARAAPSCKSWHAHRLSLLRAGDVVWFGSAMSVEHVFAVVDSCCKSQVVNACYCTSSSRRMEVSTRQSASGHRSIIARHVKVYLRLCSSLSDITLILVRSTLEVSCPCRLHSSAPRRQLAPHRDD